MDPSLRRIYWREARATLALAIPMSTGQLGQMLLGFSDSVMIGRVGVVPLAACAFALSVLNILFVAGFGLVAGVSILAAQAHGGQRSREAGEVLRHGLVIGIGAGLAIVALVYAAYPFLGFLGPPADVLTQARPFMLIVGWSLIPALAWQCLKQYCEALSHPLLPMYTMLGSVGLNIFLSWAFIYGHCGLPALGLNGAGWANLISRVAMLAFTVALVLRSPRFRAALPERWFAVLHWPRLRALHAVGVPVTMQYLFEAGVFTVAAFMMGWLGAVPLAAHQIAITYAATTFMIPLGISMAISVRVGQAVGAGDGERVRVIGLGGIGLAVAFMGCTAVMFLLTGSKLAGFVVNDIPTTHLAAQLLIIAGVFQLFDGAQVASMGALRGLSDVRAPTLIGFVSYWLISFPACYLLGIKMRFGAVGIWWGLALGLGVAAVGLLTRFLRRTKPMPMPLSPSAGPEGAVVQAAH